MTDRGIKSFSDAHKLIWIIGSSIIKRAFCYARSCGENGSQLGMAGLVEIFWQGRSGLVWNKCIPLIRHLLTVQESPDLLVIHCGGNDIGQKTTAALLHLIKQDFLKLSVILPQATMVWSQILPRLHWRGEQNHKALERSRKRVNNGIASFILNKGGKYLRYPDIVENDHLLFCDGVHLSATGHEMFLKTLKKGLDQFLFSDNKVFPDSGKSGHLS